MATRNSYDYPTSTQLVDADGNITQPWAQWVQRTQNNVRTLQQSGPTTDRPDSLLWIGRFFFDTTIGKPIWIKQVTPAVVWVDGVGTVS